ncbi:MAG: ABC transporter substrate-binding protein [Sphaerochaetaceae bacterium]|nr:ABC transporter substrate-binding protein [Sphaerochaetaceae bacterium]
MKRNILMICAIMLLGSALFASGAKEAEESSVYPQAMDEWAKEAKLGIYEGEQDWDEITRLAKEEGEVIVYSASSRMSAVGEEFSKKYPEIKVTSYDLGSVKTFEKTISEQEANIFNADIITTGGSGNFIYDLVEKNRVVNFVPSMYKDMIPLEYQEPALVRILEAMVLMYNSEIHDEAPIKNIWELTEEKYRGKVVIKDPLASLSNLMGVVSIAGHADEMAAAYKRLYGEDITLSPGVKNAGFEWIYRLLHNDLIISDSGGTVTGASGKKGQQGLPPVSITTFTYLRYNRTKDYINELLFPLDPFDGIIFPTYTAIARQAPHPNAAKLFTAFLLGDPSITLDTEIPEPYTEGEALELLQGLAPYYETGSKSPRSNIATPNGGEAWDQMNMWLVNPEDDWYLGPEVQDFWMQESSK